MSQIEIFLQGENISEILLVQVSENGTVRDIVEVARAQGFNVPNIEDHQPILALLEDSDEILQLDTKLKAAGIRHRSRVHLHRLHRVDVVVNFRAASKEHKFSTATTVGTVKKWADKQFNLTGVDATEHLLQLCNSTTRPDEDTHLGTLVHFPTSHLCFDLVPKQRVEG